MIRGDKPSGYFRTATGDGITIEGETRCCSHCGYTWEYQPGSGSRRGFCLKCRGLICARPECAAEQKRLMARFPDRTFSCLPMTDWNERMRDVYDQDPRFQVLPSGIVIAAG